MVNKILSSMELTREKVFVDNFSICTYTAMAFILAIVFCIVK